MSHLGRLGNFFGAKAPLVSIAFAWTLASAAETLPPARDFPAPQKGLDDHRRELRDTQEKIEISREERRKLESEIDSIRADRAKLAAALVETAQSARATESKIAEIERRLADLVGGEEAIELSLSDRRDVIADVLAALQRMGRKPPPALLVSPEDMLQSVRTAMLLGAVLPELESEVGVLAADLADLVRLHRSIAAERSELADEAARLAQEKTRLAALVEARQTSLDAAQEALGAERRRVAELARQAADLGDLVAKLETEVETVARAAEAARKAEERRKAQDFDGRSKSVAGLAGDPARLAPAVAFTEAKGRLPLPVSGTLLRGFGHKDGFGGTGKGMLIATRAGAFVTSPCDGWVSYAGPYRTYGQLLIVNAGQGYYIILAGMDRINVNAGQFILAGEPVALMGDGSTRTAAALAVGAVQPILYVEFRKDGTAIDPGPWWAKAELQKVRG